METLPAGFEEVTQRALRGYLRALAWAPQDYKTLDVLPGSPSEFDLDAVLDRCRNVIGKTDFTADKVKFPEPLLRETLLLDQLSAPPECLETALPSTLISNSAVARLLVGRALERAGKDDEAIDMFLLALEINPYAGAVRKAAGLALRKQGKLDDAALHLEEALELRSAIRLDGELNPHVAVLVARPRKEIDIYFYERQFYIYRRRADSVGARPIGGELYDIHRGLAYNTIRFVMHIPALRPLLLKFVQGIMRLGSQALSPVASSPAADAPGSSGFNFWASSRALFVGGARRGVKRLALWSFARPVKERVSTMREALDRALASDVRS